MKELNLLLLTPAEDCVQLAMDLSEEKSNRFIRSSIQMGRLYIEQEKWAKAEAVLNESKRIAEDLNNMVYLTDALLALERSFFKQKNNAEAIIYYKRVIDQAKTYNYLDRIPKMVLVD
ncbi:hypothetical protein SAMN05444487_10774 [Marininema mesophilum]|uniref:Tetratricopeptide repeat-containing protein n=1 Tax=Marininema mesophilum TaxID=1048340 RepID=A0A1H2X3N7_9BACL|nr:hypothetical protein [Marininema mesophilum]SDW87523.1 hypothetical protein SAMN05444487_10774 [Marininema mesophilum]